MAMNENRQVDPLGLRPRMTEIAMGQALRVPEVPEPWVSRHPATRHFYPLFESAHLPPDLQEISARFAALSLSLLAMCHDGPELTTALRRLLEAKDCAVRQRVIDRSAE